MTNREKYAEEILDIACNYGGFAVDKTTNKPVACDGIPCINCTFNDRPIKCGVSCDMARFTWSEQEYTELPVDWSKVEVDTPIVVADYDGIFWNRRHFAKYADGVVYAWASGKTSWTAADMERWNFAKLAESEVNDH